METSTVSLWVARGRTLAGYLLFACVGLVVIGLVSQCVAIVRFQLAGDITGDFERSELDWADMFYGLVVSAIFTTVGLWIGLMLLPDSSAVVRLAMTDGVRTEPDQLPSAQPDTRQSDTDHSDTGQTDTGPSGTSQQVKPHRHTRASRARDAAVQRELADRRREEEVETLMRSNPDVGTALKWMDRLLREQAEANRRDVEDAGRKDMRRDLMFFAFGTGIGIAQPVIGPQILGWVWR